MSIEPGRAIVGPSVCTVYEVGTVKPVEGLRTYVSVDGGMSDNVRTALYDADYTVTLASRSSDAAPMLSLESDKEEAALRRFDQPDDCGKRRVGADARRPDDGQTGGVQRRGPRPAYRRRP